MQRHEKPLALLEWLFQTHQHDVQATRLERHRLARCQLERFERPHLHDAVKHGRAVQHRASRDRRGQADQPVGIAALVDDRQVGSADLDHAQAGARPGLLDLHWAVVSRRERPG